MAEKAFHAERIVAPEGVETDAYLVIDDGVVRGNVAEHPGCRVVE